MSSTGSSGRTVADLSALTPPLIPMTAPLRGEGLTFTLRNTFRTNAGVPGYAFDVAEDGETIGEASLLITMDQDKVERTGHMGCELVPTFRKRGYVPRLARGLFPFVRQHGLHQLLITCDTGHTTQRQSILDLGAIPFDQLPASEHDAAKDRFLLTLP